MKRLAAVGAGLALLAGCRVVPPRPPLVETVAVLPFDNESNELDAPDILQRLVHLALLNTPYRPLDIDFVNKKLADAGITDGGQLAAVDPVLLGKDLGVHALLFGNVESFGYTNIGFYVQRKVTLELRLVDVATGETLWENNATAALRQLHLDPDEAKRAFVGGLAEQAVEKMFNSPLEAEARQATVKALRTLPGFKFAGFPNDEKARQSAGIKQAIRQRNDK